MSSQDPPPAQTTPALQMRDRLIAALLTGGDAGGVRVGVWQDNFALLIAGAEGLSISILTVENEAPDQLAQLLAALVQGNDQPGPEWHLVVVGGGPEVAGVLRKAVPRSHARPVGFHHLDATGTLTPLGTHMNAGPLTILAEAAARTDAEPLTPEQRAAALAEGAKVLRVGRPIAGSYRVTAAITAVCLVLMALELYWMDAGELSVYAAMGANSGEAIAAGEVWRLFASAFLHGGVVHFLVNMLALWSFGAMLESVLGPRRYLLLYGLSALGGAVASAYLGSGVWSVGASGAIWGLMAAGIGIAYFPRGLLPEPAVAEMRKRVWMPLLLNLGYSFQPGIDILAHLGGGVVGFALAASLLTRGLVPLGERNESAEAERGPNRALTAATVGLALVMGVSIATALATGRPWELNSSLVYRRTAIGATGFSVELPDRIADKDAVEFSDGMFHFTFGKLPESPVALEFMIGKLPPEDPPPALEDMLERERVAADQASPPDFTRVAPAARVTVGGRPGVYVEHKLNDLRLHTYIFIVDGHELLMRRYVIGAVPRAWVGSEEKIVASLQGPQVAR